VIAVEMTYTRNCTRTNVCFRHRDRERLSNLKSKKVHVYHVDI